MQWPAVERELIRRRGFPEFVRRAWHVIEPAALHWGRAADQIALHVEAQFRGTFRDLLVNVPPGSTKSTIATVMLGPWVWTIDPAMRFVHASYSSQLAHKLAEKSWNLVTSDWYRERWPDVMGTAERDAGSVGHTKTRSHGERLTTSVGGLGAGVHCDWFSIDDPVNTNDRIQSGVTKANNWIDTTVTGRAVDRSTYRRTIIMQRVHEDDPSEHAIAEGYTHLRLPARFEAENRCTTSIGGDWRTTEGETIDPVRFPEAVLTSLEHRADVWASQYQQRPAPPGGLVFKSDTFQHFEIRDVPFASTISVLSIDCSFKGAEHNDMVALEVWGFRQGKCYLYFSRCENMTFTETLIAIVEALREWPCSVVLIEDKANGPAVIEVLRQSIPNVVEFNPDTAGNKVGRAHAANAMYSARAVFHAQGATWLPRKEHNLIVFPRGRIKDDVDATSQALIWGKRELMGGFAAVPAGAFAEMAQAMAELHGGR
jgi:phage terminase large subunit-like protein